MAFLSINPATGQEFFRADGHDAAQVEAILEEASLAAPDWRDQPIAERAELLRRVTVYEQTLEAIGAAERCPLYEYPGEHFALEHYDFRLDNVLIDERQRPPTITTVDWQSVRVGKPLQDVAFFAELVGVIAGWDGKLLRTLDGGLTWDPCNSGTDALLESVACRLDGVAVGEQMAEQRPQLPVLYMTGYADRLDRSLRRAQR